MTEQRDGTLGGWILRDVLIVAVLTLLLWGLVQWHAATQGVLAALLGSVLGFVSAYIVCYIVHEWGHLLGARLAGATMPLNGYKGALLGRFDIAAHSQAQFLALSWGGVLGYLGVAAIAVSLYLGAGLAWVGAGLAVGGLAFVLQSLAVDLPQIFRVMGGEAATDVNASGATPQVILRRTWQTWVPLALVLLIWNLR